MTTPPPQAEPRAEPGAASDDAARDDAGSRPDRRPDPGPAPEGAGAWAGRAGRRPLTILAVIAASAVALVGLGLLGAQVVEEVVALRSAPHDNVQWTLSQVEVDALQLNRAALLAMEEAADPDAVRRRFDLLFSRVATLRDGDAFVELRREAEVQAGLAEIDAALRAMLPLIDGPDPALRAGLPAVAEASERLRAEARALSLEAVRLFSRSSDARRMDFQSLILRTAALAGALILLLAGTLAVLLRQISISQRSAARVAREQARLAAMVEASQDAIVLIDQHDRVLEFNSAAERILGRRREEAVGRGMAEMIVPPVLREGHRKGLARHLATGAKSVLDSGQIRMQAMRADGSVFPAEISIGSAVGESGPIFVGFLRDISDMVASEHELRRARDEAMAADRAKSEFIGVMSHEMRTPLNGVLGVLDLLGRTALDPRQARYVETARRSGEVLLHHVGDVLDIARLDARRRAADKPFDLAALLHEVGEINRAGAEAAGNLLIVDAAPMPMLLGDPNRLRQVLLNFAGNAVKFTQDGTIRLETRILSQDAEGAEVELAVADDGPGIAEEDQARVFEDFVRLDASYARRTSGAGLGLAICRRAAESLGARIGLTSAPGEGARFHLRLRLPFAPDQAAEPAAPAPAAALAPLPALEILMVEDNDVNRFVLREMLERAGHRVTEAPDGSAGVEAAGGARFDLILMDVSMPGLSGPEATRVLRAGAGPNRATPILAVTAHAGEAERRGFLEAGMQGCLIKPVRLETLEAALRAVLRGAAPEGEAPGAAAGAAPPPREEAETKAETAAEAEAADEEADEEADAEAEIIDAEVISELAETLGPAALAATVTRVCDEIAAELPAIARAARARAPEDGAAGAARTRANEDDAGAVRTRATEDGGPGQGAQAPGDAAPDPGIAGAAESGPEIPDLAAAAHRLAGAAALAGAVALRARLVAIEGAARARDGAGDRAALAAAAEGVEALGEATCAILREFADAPAGE